MSNLISGKEALIALANGEGVRYIGHAFSHEMDSKFGDASELPVDDILNDRWVFKLKPRTITINGVEVPAPFEPKEGERFHYLSDDSIDGYHTGTFSTDLHSGLVCGAYQTTEEIKQVVAALRKVFGGTA